MEVFGSLLDGGTVKDLHQGDVLRVREVGEQLGGEQEALGGVWLAGSVHKLHEALALIQGVHALVDLIYNPERADRNILRSRSADLDKNARRGHCNGNKHACCDPQLSCMQFDFWNVHLRICGWEILFRNGGKA